MDILELGAIGEFVSGVAVIGSLIYVGVQVRTSAHDQRMTAARDATRELANVVQGIVSNQESAELWLKGMNTFEELNTAERVRFSGLVGQYFRLFEQLYYQHRDGGVEPELWDGHQSQLRDFAAYRGCADWWTTRAHWYGKGFRSLVESNMDANNRPRLGYEESGVGESRKEEA